MSEQTQTSGTAPESQDSLKNLKAEVDRKLSNTTEQLSKIAKQNEELTKYVQQLVKTGTPAPSQQPTTEDDDIQSIWFDNPKLAAQKIEDRASKKSFEQFNKMQSETNKRNSIIQEVVSKFPEAADVNSEFSKKTVEIYNRYVSEHGENPMLIKTAAYEAAAELNRSMNKTDNFSLSSSGGSNRSQSSRKEAELPQETLDFAALMGLNVEDPAVVGRLKARSNRNWTRFKEGK